MNTFKNRLPALCIALFVCQLGFSQDGLEFLDFWNPDGSPIGNEYRLDSISDFRTTEIDSTIFEGWDSQDFEKDTSTYTYFLYQDSSVTCRVTKKFIPCPTCFTGDIVVDYKYENSRIARAHSLTAIYGWDDFDRLTAYDYYLSTSNNQTYGNGFKRTYNDDGNLEFSESNSSYSGGVASGNSKSSHEYFYNDSCQLEMKKSLYTNFDSKGGDSERTTFIDYKYDDEGRLIETNTRNEIPSEMDSLIISLNQQTYEYTGDSVFNKSFWFNNGEWQQTGQALKVYASSNNEQLINDVKYELEDSTWIELYNIKYEYTLSQLVKTVDHKTYDSGNLTKQIFTNYEYNEGDRILKYEKFTKDIDQTDFNYDGQYYHYSPRSEWDVEECTEYIKPEFIPTGDCYEGIINDVEESNIENDIIIYPNPSSNTFTIGFSDDSDYKSKELLVSIYSIIGEKIETFKTKAGSNKYSFGESLGSGMYIIQMSDGESFKTKMIQKL